MASADVNLPGSESKEFECDATPHVATLFKPGGTITNPSTDTVWIKEGSTTVTAGTGNGGTPIPTNGSLKLNYTTRKFAFATAANTSKPFYVPC